MNSQTLPMGGALDRAMNKSLPLIPGMSYNFNVGADRFHKPGHWGLVKGVQVLNDRDAPRPRAGIGGIDPPPWAPVKSVPETSVYPQGHGTKLPTWIAFDKQVLCFNAYFQEPIPESPTENYRIHHCRIMFYLEDDTVQVLEPKTHNSGLPQGQIIKRHRIALPAPCVGQFYTLEHFNVGCDITFYGKTFTICGCDGFTRRFLNRLGIPVPDNMEMPPDTATSKMLDKKQSQFARKPYHKVDTRGPFIQHSGHVLRFWGLWDNRCDLNGDLREFVIHYFLSDGCMEVRELIKNNSGYENYPMFIRKGKIPKKCESLVGLPGDNSPLTILNVFGSMYGTKNKKAHYMVDNLGQNTKEIEYYSDRDLAIGATLNIYGRPIILTDCDEFTRQYYREKYNVEDFTPLVLNEKQEEYVKPEPPPYTGWGTEEDSLQSWKNVELKPYVKDTRKEAEMEKDILRFEAKFHNPLQRVNKVRRFNINYYMADDTIQVYEKSHPNSGLPEGKFLIRQKVKKPGHQIEIGEKPEYYDPKDLFIGNVLNINSFDFQLISADEFTLSYMEAHKELFPHANICIVLEKCREAFGPLQSEDVLKCFAENDTCLQGVMDVRNFKTLLLQISKCGLNEHEIQTLCRAYKVETPLPGVDFKTLQSVVQTELRRYHFDKILLQRVEYTLRYHDPCRTGKVDRETLRGTLKGAKLPLYKDILDFLVDKYPAAEGDLCNRVDYCDFLHFLDWEDYPAPQAKPAAIKCVLKWSEPKPPLQIFCVNYRAFLESVCPNFKCSLPTVCCCCNENKPCPEHPCDKKPEPTDFCPVPEEKSPLEECPPQQPVTVAIQPTCITYKDPPTHSCAPGAKCCNYECDRSKDLKAAEQDFQESGQTSARKLCAARGGCC